MSDTTTQPMTQQEIVEQYTRKSDITERLIPPTTQPRTTERQLEARSSLAMTANVLQSQIADALRDAMGYDHVLPTDQLAQNLLVVEKLRDMSMALGPVDYRMVEWDKNTFGSMILHWVADDTMKFLITRFLTIQGEMEYEPGNTAATQVGYRTIYCHLAACQTAWYEMLDRTSSGRYHPNLNEYWPILMTDTMWDAIDYVREEEMLRDEYSTEWAAFEQACLCGDAINPIAILASMDDEISDDE